MKTTKKICAASWLLGLVLSIAFNLIVNCAAQERRAITASDCITVRRILQDDARPSIRFNPQGTAAAYLVQVPNLISNENDIRLDLAPLGGTQGDAHHLFVGTHVSSLQWTDNGHAVALLADHNGRISIVKVAVPSRHVTVLATAATGISEFSISEDGKTIAFALEEKRGSTQPQRTAIEEAHGYRIPFERPESSQVHSRKIYVIRRTQSGWTEPQMVTLRLPTIAGLFDTFPYVLNLRLALSPDGSSLLLTFLLDASRVPAQWKESPMVRSLITTSGGVEVMPILNLKSNKASLPFASPWAYSAPYWSPDSRSFVVTAISPANSTWDRDDAQHHRAPLDAAHQFEVRVSDGTVHLVRSDLHGYFGRPASWSRDGDLLMRTGDTSLSRLEYLDGQWKETSQILIPMEPGQFKTGELASNGSIIVGDYETPSVPPSLLIYKAGDSTSQRLIHLNPQFDGLTLAPYREIHWDTSTGFRATGYLFIPPDYDAHKRYPLVIHAYPAASNFFCDSGFNHMPSFAPQPLANAGIMYLIRIYTDGAHQSDEEEHAPPGYPGQLSEAAFQTDVFDSAVDKLSSDGLIDPKKVGIIGFSRSGWYTEFALTHGRTRYAAATLADNVEYSLGEYWVVHTSDTLRSYDAMFGGPPYGDTLKQWLDHSISFNIQKIQTPVLMEIMGYGTRYTDSSTAPSGIVEKEELFTGLNRLGKPVEMYYYPFEMHQPDDPLARLGSLERNVDWYSFWLKGVERPETLDSQQYQRWRELKKSYVTEQLGPAASLH